MRFFDTRAALAKIQEQAATPAIPAISAIPDSRIARIAEIAAPPPATQVLDDALDAAEERAAIIDFDGGLSRAEAEALALRQHGPDILAALNRDDLSTDNLTFALLRRLTRDEEQT